MYTNSFRPIFYTLDADPHRGWCTSRIRFRITTYADKNHCLWPFSRCYSVFGGLYMFSYVQVGEVMPFIDELLASINSIICDLQPQQVQTFYEAVGHMISARYFFYMHDNSGFLGPLLIWRQLQQSDERSFLKLQYNCWSIIVQSAEIFK